MKLALVSDIHGNLPALQAVLADIGNEPVDAIVNLGDILSGPLWPGETADTLMAMQLPTIAGNHERQLLTLPRGHMSATDAFAADCLAERHRDWLRTLPATLRLEPAVLCCHGTPTSDLIYLLETTTPDYGRHGSPGVRAATADELHQRLGATSAGLVVCGHSHVPRVCQTGAALVVNPGSVGLQAFDDDHVNRHVVETGSPLARYARVDDGTGAWRVRLCCVPYDHEAAARRATHNGRGDWAHALRRGDALRPVHWATSA